MFLLDFYAEILLHNEQRNTIMSLTSARHAVITISNSIIHSLEQ